MAVSRQMVADGYLDPDSGPKRGRPPKEKPDGVPADLRDWREAWEEYCDDSTPDEGDDDDYEELRGICP